MKLSDDQAKALDEYVEPDETLLFSLGEILELSQTGEKDKHMPKVWKMSDERNKSCAP